MAYSLWSQDIFSKGELSPYLYARCTVNEYNNGVKTGHNVLSYPSGALGKRFGTLFQAINTHITSSIGVFMETFQYLDECVYQLIFSAGFIDIYLEGVLVATVTTTFNNVQVEKLITTVLSTTFRVTGFGFKPYDLVRSNAAGSNVTSFSANSIACAAAPFTANLIFPVQFSVTGGTILQTSPQIITNKTYFAFSQSTTTIVLFETPQEAKFAYLTGNFANAITISGAGTGTTSVIIQNTWTFNNTVFKNLPVYDFNSALVSYDALTFTPSAVTGAAVTITVSGAGYSLLDASYVGGAFIGAGGTSRITAVASATSFTVSVQQPFDSTNPIAGSLSFLAEPAWSDIRGWPQVCSSYQSRALFANTPSLPNGFYASVINDYSDFGDLTSDDDDAISWYPTSDNMNFIRFIVPYRSLTVHTNTGIYSSPLSDVSPITPKSFTLQLQDSTPADVLQPVAIDNQVLVLSGDDAHQMLWDGINNAYTSDIVSVINEQTIRSPVDETPFVDLHRAGSRFVFIINANGSMAVFQTLLSQNVAGFLPQTMEQSYGNASFLQAASSADGRAWFLVQRQIAQAIAPVAITGFTATTLTAVASNFATTPTAVKFTTTGTLPASSPALTTTNYFWAVGIDADTFNVYSTMADALTATNPIIFTDAGTSSNVVAWPLTTIYTLEELTKDVFLDCAVYYNGSPASTLTTGTLFNAQSIKMVGDGFGFDAAAENNVNNQVTFISHGITTQVSIAYTGFPIHSVIEPMPLNIAMGYSQKQSVITKPLNVRFARFMFNNTIGGTVNGVPIALSQFDEVVIGEPPTPQRGIFEMSIFNGWDDFNNPIFTIEHNEPFDIQLLGVFYNVETS